MQYVYLLNSLTTPFLEYYMIFYHLYAYRYRPYFLIALFGIKSVPVFGHTDSPCIASLRLGCFWHGCCIYCLGNIQVPYHSIIAFHGHPPSFTQLSLLGHPPPLSLIISLYHLLYCVSTHFNAFYFIFKILFYKNLKYFQWYHSSYTLSTYHLIHHCQS